MVKHENSPTLTGTVEWQNYMNFLENEFKKYGVVDIYKNSWDFDRWDISEDPSNWTLSIEDNKFELHIMVLIQVRQILMVFQPK